MVRTVAFELVKQKAFWLTFTGIQNGKKVFLISFDLGIRKPTIITRRALVAMIRREGCSRTTECVKLPLFSMNSSDGKPAALRE